MPEKRRLTDGKGDAASSDSARTSRAARGEMASVGEDSSTHSPSDCPYAPVLEVRTTLPTSRPRRASSPRTFPSPSTYASASPAAGIFAANANTTCVGVLGMRARLAPSSTSTCACDTPGHSTAVLRRSAHTSRPSRARSRASCSPTYPAPTIHMHDTGRM